MALLQAIDKDRLLFFPKAREYANPSIYAETVSSVIIEIREKCESVKFLEQAGTAITGRSGSTVWNGYAQDIAADGCSSFLTETEIQEFLQIGRGAISAFPKINLVSLRFVFEKKKFEIWNAGVPTVNGLEEQSAVIYRWQVEGQEEILKDRRQHSFKGMTLLKNPILEDMDQSLKRNNPWPVPGGEVPVYWESLALAKVLLPFVRVFEGDVFLAKHSLLAQENLRLPFSFSMEDAPQTEVDCEGTPTRNFLFFQKGKPLGLALDKMTSQQMGVGSTGHSRRQNYLSQPTVGFWNVGIFGDQIDENLASQFQWGLSVRDLEVKEWDSQSGKITLRVFDARLVHQGVVGESVNPFLISTHLVELLSTLVAFSPTQDPHGFVFTKSGQKNFIQLRVPPAISAQVFLIGEVPKQHYW